MRRGKGNFFQEIFLPPALHPFKNFYACSLFRVVSGDCRQAHIRKVFERVGAWGRGNFFQKVPPPPNLSAYFTNPVGGAMNSGPTGACRHSARMLSTAESVA